MLVYASTISCLIQWLFPDWLAGVRYDAGSRSHQCSKIKLSVSCHLASYSERQSEKHHTELAPPLTAARAEEKEVHQWNQSSSTCGLLCPCRTSDGQCLWPVCEDGVCVRQWWERECMLWLISACTQYRINGYNPHIGVVVLCEWMFSLLFCLHSNVLPSVSLSPGTVSYTHLTLPTRIRV